MNPWTKKSIEIASRPGYLDLLYAVYPILPSGRRTIPASEWDEIKIMFEERDNIGLFKLLLKQPIFPIKDSYVASFKLDESNVIKNPETVRRISARLYEMGLDEIFEKCTEPKETNRQMGQLFKKWITSGVLGIKSKSPTDFEADERDAVLDASDTEMTNFARENLDYQNEKRLDLVIRKNNQYIIGEAKFLTDRGGNQNNQFKDAKNIFDSSRVKATVVAVLDGVLYIPGRNSMYQDVISNTGNIMSALVLKEFINSL